MDVAGRFSISEAALAGAPDVRKSTKMLHGGGCRRAPAFTALARNSRRPGAHSMSHDAYATPAEVVLGSLGLPSLRVCKDAMKREADF